MRTAQSCRSSLAKRARKEKVRLRLHKEYKRDRSRQHQAPRYLHSMVPGRKNEGLGCSHQLQVPVPTSRPTQLIVGTHRVRSMDKVNAADRTQTYRYVMIPSLSAYGPTCRYHSWQSLLGRGVVKMVDLMLILCQPSVLRGLSPMGLLQASIHTLGLNDNSPLRLHNQIHSPGMVRRSMLPRRKKETSI